MKLPNQWHSFIKIFQKKFDSEIVYDIVHIFQDEETINERFTTHEFEIYLPDYIPVADDSGSQIAVISKNDKDTKVYLTSYGTLQEKEFRILDRDLLHWMQQKFPFDQKESEMTEMTAEQQAIFEKENDRLLQKMSQFPSLLNFWKQTYSIENLCLPENYPVVEDILAFQEGYAFSSVVTEKLIGEKAGDFRDSWLVIASNYFADPFFIDFNDVKEDFPVYFAFHGAGKWTPIQIADSISEFQEILNEIFENRFDSNYLESFLKELTSSGNEFWDEVYQNVLDMSDYTEEEQNEKSDESDWREAEVYIIDIGPNKMKIVSLLKEVYKLSGTEALQMSKQNRILYHKGPYKWIQSSARELESLGATIEIVTL
ncbi:SMI1/KNR4 family protein [Chryseobacterium sp.]|uniref:SMI1/KNR4 family protein n=1 Tax=Chryseobacterium sp. TaxID=1871047 RepID=UPI0024E27095|nr:SMI1/KNR4 family protein [Chryseobacterium sp.]